MDENEDEEKTMYVGPTSDGAHRGQQWDVLTSNEYVDLCVVAHVIEHHPIEDDGRRWVRLKIPVGEARQMALKLQEAARDIMESESADSE